MASSVDILEGNHVEYIIVRGGASHRFVPEVHQMNQMH